MKTTSHTYRLSACAALVATLCACAAPERLGQKISDSHVTPRASVKAGLSQNALPLDDTTRGSAAAADARAKTPIVVAKRATQPWVGSRFVDVQSDRVLPPIFNEVLPMQYDDRSNARVTIRVIAERLSRLTGVPVRIAPDVYQGAGVGARPSTSGGVSVGTPIPLMPNSAMPMPVGSGGMPSGTPLPQGMSPVSMPMQNPALQSNFEQPITDVSSIEMKWDGTPAGFLDHITSVLNLSWAYRDGAVVIERFSTESFELSSFGGKQTYKLALSGGNSGTSGQSGSTGQANASMDVTETGVSEAMNSLVETVKQVVSRSGGTVTLNEASARLIVTAPRDVLTRVRDVIRVEDAAMSRQVQIQFDIYSVINNDADERGVNWDMLVNSVWSGMMKSPSSLTGSTSGQMGVSILSGVAGSSTSQRFGGSSLIFNALNQMGESSTYTPLSMIGHNRQWARKQNLQSEAYISETTPSTSTAAGSGQVGLKTSTIATGEKVIVQPAIMDNGDVILKFGVSLSSLLGLTDQTVGSGSTLQKVQTPKISGSDDQSTVRLKPGEAMVMTGLSRRFASTDQRTLSEDTPIGLGGSRKMIYKREDFLVVVRASAL